MTCALITKFDGLVTALAVADSVKNPSPDLVKATARFRKHLLDLLGIQDKISGAFNEFDTLLFEKYEPEWPDFVKLLPPLQNINEAHEEFFLPGAVSRLRAIIGERLDYEAVGLLYSSSSSTWRSKYAKGGLGVTLPAE
ncbi:MAG: hypothetical protein V4726_00195 [Verrucomicrobiota bacterium]